MTTQRLDRPAVLTVLLMACAAALAWLQRPLWQAMTDYQPLSGSRVLLLMASTLALTWLLYRLAPRACVQLTGRIGQHLGAQSVLGPMLVGLAFLLPLTIGVVILDGFPNSGDEYAYLFQARRLAQGQLWAAAPPLGDTFVPYRTWLLGGKWLSQYPPGWPLVMAGALLLQLPGWLASSLLGAGCVVLLMRLSRRSGATPAASLPLLALYILTPFYLYNAASFFSHLLAAVLILACCLVLLRFERDARAGWLLTAGALLGLLGITRYFSALLLLPALAAWWLVRPPTQRLRALLYIALGAFPAGLLLLAYQYAISGHPLHSSYSLITVKDVSLSVRPGDLLLGARLSVHRLIELGLWTTPLLPFFYAAALLAKYRARTLAFYDLVFPTFVLGYVLFADLGANRYGPRYYFDAYPLLLLTLVSARSLLRPTPPDGQSPQPARIAAALLISTVYLLVSLPLSGAAWQRQVFKREELYRLTAQLHLHDAIVIVGQSGSRGLLADDLARNEPPLDAPVLYARAEASVADLRRMFPRRSIWLYRHEVTRATLQLLSAPGA